MLIKNALPITATFLGEVQADYEIPDQNWSDDDWDADFAAMKAVGIDTVVAIRCGVRKKLLYPSEYLMKNAGCDRPRQDKLKLFFRLAEKHGLKLWVGSYFSGHDWLMESYDLAKEIDWMKYSFEEIWENYAKNSPAFGGWYLSQETGSPRSKNVFRCYRALGEFCHNLSGHQTLISPGVHGPNCGAMVNKYGMAVARQLGVTPEEQRENWGNILADIRGAVDIVAFQNSQLAHDTMPEFLKVHHEIITKNGMIPWTNVETFELEVSHRTFPPISFEPLLDKLEWTAAAGFQKAITYEFSHFMSPNACAMAARNLYKLYKDYFGFNK